VALDSANARAHAALAVTLVAKGWMTGAELELQRAIELDPNFGEAHFNLALVCLQRLPPAVELARRHYQRAIDLGENPDPAIEKKLAAAP
jgi:Flp pilus assembly protein TadD